MEIQIHFRRNSNPFTPAGPISFSGRYIRQDSSLDHYGHVEVVLEPIPEYAGKPSWEAPSRYTWEVQEDVVPSIFFDSVLEGIKQALEEDGAPFDFLKATKVRVVGGSFNETDSQPHDYVVASREAMRDTLRRVASDGGIK